MDIIEVSLRKRSFDLWKVPFLTNVIRYVFIRKILHLNNAYLTMDFS